MTAHNRYTLLPTIKFRAEMLADGGERRVKRKASNAPPGMPRASSDVIAFRFICPVTRDYVVCARGESRKIGDKHYVCYQTFQQRAAALMYAHMVGR